MQTQQIKLSKQETHALSCLKEKAKMFQRVGFSARELRASEEALFKLVELGLAVRSVKEKEYRKTHLFRLA